MHTERRSPCVLKWRIACRRPVIVDVIQLGLNNRHSMQSPSFDLVSDFLSSFDSATVYVWSFKFGHSCLELVLDHPGNVSVLGCAQTSNLVIPSARFDATLKCKKNSPHTGFTLWDSSGSFSVSCESFQLRIGESPLNDPAQQ